MRSFAFLITLFFLPACSHTEQTATPQPPAAATRGTCVPYEAGPVPRTFEDFDTDHDGKLTRAEFLCQVVRQFRDADTDHDDYIEQSEAKSVGPWLRVYDPNHASPISIIEFMHAAEAYFDAADHDHDRLVKKAEFEAAALRRP